VSRYQKGKTNLDLTEARGSERQWHQLGHTQVCTLLQTDNHTSTSPLKFFTGRMPFMPPNQQHQSTEGQKTWYGMVNVDLYSAVITKVSNALNMQVSEEKPGFQACLKDSWSCCAWRSSSNEF